MRTPEPRIAAHAVQPLLHGLHAAGVDVPALLRRCGIEDAAASDAEHRLPLAALDPLWAGAAEAMGDLDFGLHAAESVAAGSFGILSYRGVTSATWGDGLARVEKYFGILSDASGYRLDVDGPRARVVAFHHAPARGPARQRVEFTVAVLHCYADKF